ncbi:hypothetical protein ACFXI0_09915 [Kitasatospora indigofera]|uniref:hypothetical protein n=1 Tax=Kitasatospora indigofera TaxID=67307 RepID=UPI00369433ED
MSADLPHLELKARTVGATTDFGLYIYAPHSAYDPAWTIAPAWREQLAEGGVLVGPLEIHGYTRAIAFRREGEVLRAMAWTHCGFIRDAGTLGRAVPEAVLAGGGAAAVRGRGAG